MKITKTIILGLIILGLIFSLSGGVSGEYCGTAIKSCSCGDTLNTSYTLTAADPVTTTNCSDNGLVIGNSNTILDCNGSTLTGKWIGHGIINENNNVTIKNCNVTHYKTGIYMYNSSNNTIINNTANSNDLYGIILANSTNSIIKKNTANSNTGYLGTGIGVANYSANNTILENTAAMNLYYGLYIGNSSNNSMVNNELYNNTYRGIFIDNSSFNFLDNNKMYNNSWDGIYIHNSSFNSLDNNKIYNNSRDGICMNGSSFNSLYNNEVYNSKSYNGIYLGKSSNNSLINNRLHNNADSIFIDNSSFNSLKNNKITNNTRYGVYMTSNSKNNTLTENMVCWNLVLQENCDFHTDIYDDDSNSGDNNTCETTFDWCYSIYYWYLPVWKDASVSGSSGCKYSCLTTGLISGYVNYPNGTPASGVNITAINSTTGKSTLTDNKGNYNIILLKGLYNVSASRPEYLPDTNHSNVNVTAGFESFGYNFTMAPILTTGSISGYVNYSNGNPASGVNITAINSTTGEYAGSTLTDGNGNYTIILSPGVYNVSASKSGYLSNNSYSNVEVNAGESFGYNFTMAPILTTGSISGYVNYSNGNPASGVNITAINSTTGEYAGSTLTDGNGNYTIILSPGVYNVSASKSRYLSNNNYSNVEVNAGESFEYNFTMTSILPNTCDLNHDGIVIHDYNDLMTAYKCFLGINQNCNTINYQGWNLMSQEYNCFARNFN